MAAVAELGSLDRVERIQETVIVYPIGSLFVVCALALLTSGCSPSGPAVAADAIYVGGSIVTVNDAQPNAEALAVKDGTILAVGAPASGWEAQPARRCGWSRAGRCSG